jgi:hypothetical protein
MDNRDKIKSIQPKVNCGRPRREFDPSIASETSLAVSSIRPFAHRPAHSRGRSHLRGGSILFRELLGRISPTPPPPTIKTFACCSSSTLFPSLFFSQDNLIHLSLHQSSYRLIDLHLAIPLHRLLTLPPRLESFHHGSRHR